MDNNWSPTAQVGEAPMDTGDWRTQLQYDSRQRIVNKIMETLKRHLPFSCQEGLLELKKIAVRFEEKIYTAATSQPDYLRKISLEMLTWESNSQNTIPNPLLANPAANSNELPDLAASHSMQTQVRNQGQSLSILSDDNQSQAHQQLLSQNLQNNIATAGVQGSTGLESALPSVSGILQTPMASVVCQNNNMQNMSSMFQTVSPFNCPICLGPFIEETTTRCGHIFCKKCITAALAVRKECPACRRRVVAKDLIRVFLPTTD